MWGRIFDLIVVIGATIAGIALYYNAPSGSTVLQWLSVMAGVYVFRVLIAPWLCWVSGFWTGLLLQSWYIFPFTLVMLMTALATRISLALPGWVGVPDTEIAMIVPLAFGALNGLIAAAFLDDARNDQSVLWPMAVVRSVIYEAFGNRLEEVEPEDYPLAWDLVHRPRFALPGEKKMLEGWRLGAAVGRIQRLQTLFHHARIAGAGEDTG